MKHIKEFKLFEEGTAMATMGNTGGMGAIVSPGVSATPGDVGGSTSGSGDIAAHDTGTAFKIDAKTKKTTKKKTKRKKRGIGESANDKETMYVTKFQDWDYPNESNNPDKKLSKQEYIKEMINKRKNISKGIEIKNFYIKDDYKI